MEYSGLLRFFQIKGAEIPTFLNMLGHSFFNALAIAYSFTAINVLLVEQHGIENLPYIYVLGGVLILVAGKIYAHLESRLPPIRLFSIVIAFCFFWALAARSIDLVEDTLLFVSFLYALYLVIYQLSNLEFWGVASLIYDVRQSKRLFGMLTTGESVAKILGYMSTPVIAIWFSVFDLFIFAGLSFLISYFFLRKLTRINRDNFVVAHHHDHGDEEHPSSANWLSVFRIKDPFLRATGLFALLAALVYYFIHYTFLNRVEVHFREIEDLAYFFGLFFSLGTFLNLMNRLLLFNRLIKLLRIGNMILILPIVLGLLTLTGLFGVFFIEDPLFFMLWIFGLIMLMDEIIRSSIHLPSFFVLFQPLSRHKRLEGHTLAKGRMEPLGMLLAGACMLALVWLGRFDFQLIILCLAAGIMLWVFIGFRVSAMYNELIRFILKNRLLTSRGLDFSGEEMKVFREGDPEKTDPVNLLYHLKVMGAELSDAYMRNALSRLLSDEDPLVLSEALDLVKEFKDVRFVPYLRELVVHRDTGISGKAVSLLCSFLEDESVDELADSIKQCRGLRQEQMIAGVLKYSGIYGATIYGPWLMKKVDSKNREDRLSAARTIGMIGLKDYYHPLVKLLKDGDSDIRREAIKSAAKVGNERLIPRLFEIVISGKLFRQASGAIESFGSSAIPFLKSELDKSYDKRIQQRLLKIAGQIDHPRAIQLLVKYLDDRDVALREVAINGVYFSHAKMERETILVKVDGLIDKETNYFNVLVAQYLSPLAEQEVRLRSSIVGELGLQRKRMLKILGLWYGRKLIQRVEDNLRSSDRDQAVNAVELLENRLKRRHATNVIPIVEFSFETLYDWKKSHSVYKKDQGLEAFFKGDCICASEWLIALMIRIYRERGLTIPTNLLPQLQEFNSEAVAVELAKKN